MSFSVSGSGANSILAQLVKTLKASSSSASTSMTTSTAGTTSSSSTAGTSSSSSIDSTNSSMAQMSANLAAILNQISSSPNSGSGGHHHGGGGGHGIHAISAAGTTTGDTSVASTTSGILSVSASSATMGPGATASTTSAPSGADGEGSSPAAALRGLESAFQALVSSLGAASGSSAPALGGTVLPPSSSDAGAADTDEAASPSSGSLADPEGVGGEMKAFMQALQAYASQASSPLDAAG